jgi:Bacterial Ig-like domain (group 2)
VSHGSKSSDPSAGSGGSGADGSHTCGGSGNSCTVTLSPKDLKICGAGSTKDITATGNPSGGTYTFSSSDNSIASVAGTGNKGTITVVAQGTVVITVTYVVSGCTPCRDTANVKVCTCTPKAGGGRYYSHAGPKDVDDLIGVKAKIKTRYGKLCCEDEGCSTVDAFHVVYVNISNNSAGLIWAQTGWGRERNAGSAAIKKYRYAEMRGTPDSPPSNNYDTGNAPADGSTHEYRCDLNVATGKWDFLFDGTAWEHFTDNGWKDQKGTDVQWTGEIYNKEDDMPGTSGDKCNFTECQYCIAGSAYQDAGFVDADINSSDASEWGSERKSGTAFNMWDKKPL